MRGARAFAALSRPRDHAGTRRRSGPVTVSWIPSPTESGRDVASDPSQRVDTLIPPAVAFAIGRKVGPAVVRNRLRRRLRAEMSDLARAGLIARGCYLIGVAPGAGAIEGRVLRGHLRSALGVEA